MRQRLLIDRRKSRRIPATLNLTLKLYDAASIMILKVAVLPIVDVIANPDHGHANNDRKTSHHSLPDYFFSIAK
jgi:hypothetical protein